MYTLAANAMGQKEKKKTYDTVVLNYILICIDSFIFCCNKSCNMKKKCVPTHVVLELEKESTAHHILQYNESFCNTEYTIKKT